MKKSVSRPCAVLSVLLVVALPMVASAQPTAPAGQIPTLAPGSWLWSLPGQLAEALSAFWLKVGLSIDPDGEPLSGPATEIEEPGASAGDDLSEEGFSIDPNGGQLPMPGAAERDRGHLVDPST